MKRHNAGFTLTEISVVIGIVFLLAAILLSVTLSARKSADTKTCLANMHSLSTALSLYRQDYDSTYPAVDTAVFNKEKDGLRGRDGLLWSEALLPYLRIVSKSVPCCPSRDANAVPESASWNLQMGYAYNINLSEVMVENIPDTKHVQGRPDYQLNYESLIVVLLEARLGISGLAMPDAKKTSALNYIYSIPLKKAIDTQKFGATRHNGGANYAFADGHMKWLRPEKLNIDEKCDGKTAGFGL